MTCSISLKSRLAAAIALATVAFTAGAASAAVDLVTFDPPTQALGPSTYAAAGGQQTINTVPATFTGGVILGFATYFPAISYATAPNVYGTADFGSGLARTLDININPTFTATEVGFALFNGETFNQSYKVTAYDGANTVASVTLGNMPSNFNSGYGVVDLKASNITRVVIAPIGTPKVWDFLIDTVTFNQSPQDFYGTPPSTPFTPPPRVTVKDSHGNDVLIDLIYGDSSDGQATLNSIESNNAGPAPEPDAYALMLVAIGGIGGILRSRRARSGSVRKAPLAS